MDVFEAVEARRSIRKFNKNKISKESIQKLLEMAVLAPSPKNMQTWKYVVLNGKNKLKLFNIVLESISKKSRQGITSGSSVNSSKIIAHASNVILVYNTERQFKSIKDLNDKLMWLAEIQAIGAGIENLLLAATNLKIGTLWVCDVLYAEEEINEWLQTEHELIAAVALGYFDNTPEAIGRKPINEVVEWLID